MLRNAPIIAIRSINNIGVCNNSVDSSCDIVKTLNKNAAKMSGH